MLGLPSICWTHLEGLEQWNAWAAGSCLQEQMAQFPGSDYGGSRSDVCVCVWGESSGRGWSICIMKSTNVKNIPSSGWLFTITLLLCTCVGTLSAGEALGQLTLLRAHTRLMWT